MRVSVDPTRILTELETRASAAQPAYRRRLVHLAVEAVVVQALSVTCEHLILPQRRSRPVIFARHLAIYLARFEGGFTLAQAGELFARNRSAAAYAINQIEARRDHDAAFDETVTALSQHVRLLLAQPIVRAAEAPDG